MSLNQTIRFLGNNYKSWTDDVLRGLKKLFNVYPDNICVIRENGSPVSVAYFIRIGHVELNAIRNNPDILKDGELLLRLSAQTGENLHFLFCASKGVKNLKRLADVTVKKLKPKTISWFYPNSNNFFIKEV